MSNFAEAGGCNIHVHTVYSDGMKTAEEVIAMAREKGLKYIVFTEHNLFDPRIPVLREKYAAEGLEIINGIEFSARHKLKNGRVKELHIVCVLFDPDHPAFIEFMKHYEGREAFIRELCRRLEEHQMYLTYEELVETFPETRALGVVHVAKMMMMKNYVNDIDEAMDYVGSRGKKICYVNKAEFMNLPSMETCIHYIKQFKGFPIYAHPYYPTDISEEERIEMMQRFMELTGPLNGGIEVYYKDYTEEEENWILAQTEGKLYPSCGSDYHGIYVDDRLDSYNPEIIEVIKMRHQEMYGK